MTETITEKIDINYILQLVKEEPNDMVLGGKIRMYIYDLQEAR